MEYKFIKIEDNKIIVDTEYLEAYIPDKLFKKNLNEYMGDVVNIMGIFNFRIGNKNGTVDTKSKLFTFNFPSMITTKPASYEVKQLELMDGSGIQKYHVLKYFKGDAIFTTTDIVIGIDNVEKFVNLLLEAALPSTLGYETILKSFLKCLEINNETANVTAALISVVCSELARYGKDTTLPFRKVIGKGKANEYDFTLVNARSVCANSSTFSALTFEDIDTMLVYSINRKRYNKKETPSPLEKIIQI